MDSYNLTPAYIKMWLKQNGLTRDWLADQCGVAKRSVDGWLSGGRLNGTPKRLVACIIKITDLQNQQTKPIERMETLVLQFTQQEWKEIQIITKHYPKSLAEIAEDTLKNIASQLLASDKKIHD